MYCTVQCTHVISYSVVSYVKDRVDVFVYSMNALTCVSVENINNVYAVVVYEIKYLFFFLSFKCVNKMDWMAKRREVSG
jgi:hypothetical protein